VPVAAHPPAATSDLTFEALVARFVELAVQPRKEETNEESSRPLPLGLKLDFKDPRAVEPCLGLLQEAVARAGWRWTHPIWLNADIFTGPGGQPTKFDAEQFLLQVHSSSLPNTSLSLGWTTGWSLWTCVGLHGYSTQHVESALGSLAKLERPMPVTWAVRLPIIAQTSPALVRRLTENDRTLTCWGDLGWREGLWLSSPEIRPLAFIDSAPPGRFLLATYCIQLTGIVALVGAGMMLLRGRSGQSFRGAFASKPEELSV
jgi:hypothetical protein